jgi:predicted O-methyltransferase YrrM
MEAALVESKVNSHSRLAETCQRGELTFRCAAGGGAQLSAANGLKALWLAYLSKPADERVLYRLIRKRKLRKIVEIGIGSGQRALRMISLAQRYQQQVRYTGIDWFEARPDESSDRLTLKTAYRVLRASGSRIHLVPRDAHEAFARLANALSGNELVVIDSHQPLESLGRIWFFLPRMLAPQAIVLATQPTGERRTWRPLPLAEIHSLGAEPRRRAA